MASTIIDLQYGAVVQPLLSSGSQTNGNGTGQDLNNGTMSTNLILNIGTATGDATVKAQESDDNSTWSDISDSTFTVTGGGVSSNSVQVKRVLRSKRYIRSNVSGVTATVNFDLTVVAQKHFVYDESASTGNTGSDKSPSS
jgi:hypothetical protein